MTIVWSCALSVETYVEAGRAVEVPRPDCPSCAEAMTFWFGYWRSVRDAAGLWQRMWAPRVHCDRCSQSTHALLPSFVLSGRLDVVETIGRVLDDVSDGRPVAQAAAAVGLARTTVRGWVRRFESRAEALAVSFAALSVELSGAVVRPTADRARWAVAVIGAAFRAACELPGWLTLGKWRFVSSVTGGKLLATNMNLSSLFIGKRRFIAPIP